MIFALLIIGINKYQCNTIGNEMATLVKIAAYGATSENALVC